MEIAIRVELSVGERWEARLPGRGAAGYQWFHEVAGPPEVIDVTLAQLPPPSPPKASGEPPQGGSSDELVEVRALRPGTVSLSLTQRRSWETGKAPLRQHSIQIVVEEGSGADPAGRGGRDPRPLIP